MASVVISLMPNFSLQEYAIHILGKIIYGFSCNSSTWVISLNIFAAKNFITMYFENVQIYVGILICRTMLSNKSQICCNTTILSFMIYSSIMRIAENNKLLIIEVYLDGYFRRYHTNDAHTRTHTHEWTDTYIRVIVLGNHQEDTVTDSKVVLF